MTLTLSGASPSTSLLSLFGWDPQGLVQLSARSLMGTGGWGSSAFSSPLGMALLADRQLLGWPPQWATPTQQSPVGALSASGWPRMKYCSQLWNTAPPVEKYGVWVWGPAGELYSDRILRVSSFPRRGLKRSFISQSDGMLLGHPRVPSSLATVEQSSRRDGEAGGGGDLVEETLYSCTAPCSSQTAACYCVR